MSFMMPKTPNLPAMPPPPPRPPTLADPSIAQSEAAQRAAAAAAAGGMGLDSTVKTSPEGAGATSTTPMGQKALMGT